MGSSEEICEGEGFHGGFWSGMGKIMEWEKKRSWILIVIRGLDLWDKRLKLIG